jgi:hypothetical protein
MKKDAQMVFGLPEDSPIKVVFGSVIDAQSFPLKNTDTQEQLTLLEYRLKPALNPDEQLSKPDDGEGCLDTEASITHEITLDENENVLDAIAYLDKAMTYIYATHGINNARLVRNNTKLSFIETPDESIEVEDALAIAGGAYSVHSNLSEDIIIADNIYECFLNFSVMMNLGDCERNEKGNVLKFTGLLNHSLSEFFGEGRPEQDVTLTLNDDYTMTLRYDNERNDPVAHSYKVSREAILDAMEDLWSIGKARGYTDDRRLNFFTNLIALGNNKLSVERNVEFMVPQKPAGLHKKALEKFMKTDMPANYLN